MEAWARRSIALGMLFAMITLFWWPALFSSKTIFHGDSIVHALPLFELHSAAMHRGESLLWSDKVYGGHPIYAESQGAFFQPLNILLAWLVPPIYGHNLFHFICMLVSGVGVFGLCRSLGMRQEASGFGAIAVAFATIWTASQQNLSIAGALSWIPALFWAAESWLQKPCYNRAILMAIAVTFIFFAGYPQALHGSIVYLIVSLLPTCLSAAGQYLWRTSRHKLMVTGGLSIFFATGLSAVQWLPLIELTSLSHRNAGIELFWPIKTLEPFYRGLFFAIYDVNIRPEQYMPSVGSVLVPSIASLIFFVPTSDRIKGHVLATVLLFQLGMGPASPVFNFLYDAHWVPGIHFFRTMVLYLAVAVIGFAVVAAWVVDRLTKGLAVRRFWLVGGVTALLVVWITTLIWLYIPSVRYRHFVFALTGLVILATLQISGRQKYIALTLFGLLCAEVGLTRFHPFTFVSSDLIRESDARALLTQEKNISDYKFLDASIAVVYGMKNPLAQDLPNDLQRLLAALSPMTNLMWGIASLNGMMGLETQRRALIESIVQDEIANRSLLPVGRRMIDVLGVRYITADLELSAPGLRLAQQDVKNHIWVMENTAALPRFQTYSQAIYVTSAEQAKQYFEEGKATGLIVEKINCNICANYEVMNNNAQDGEIRISEIEKATPTHYALDVIADRAGWLFMADSNYPGWEASIDGNNTPVLSANILGKAVHVSPGAHRIEIMFKPHSFYLGLCITAFSLLAAVGCVFRERLRFKQINRNNSII